MNLRTFTLLLAIVGSVATVSASIERRVQRSFAVTAGSAAVLKVDTFSGNVSVVKGGDNVVKITVFEKSETAKTAAEMDELLAPLHVQMQMEGAAVSLVSTYDQKVTWSWKSWPPITLAYRIEVPERCDVEADASAGSITISNLTGKMKLTGDTEKITTGAITGTITAKNVKGDITVMSCTGAVTAHTMIGAISLGTVQGPVDVSSSGGNISLRDVAGAVTVRGNASNIRVGFTSTIKNPADIQTSGGNILLMFRKDSNCALDLSASMFSHVEVKNLAIKVNTIGPGGNLLMGNLNTGGTLIKANASGGAIAVLGFAPMPVISTPINAPANAVL